MVLVNISLPLLTIVYVWIRKLHKKTWGGDGVQEISSAQGSVFMCAFFQLSCYAGWGMEALQGWWEFLRLGLPGVAMICIEWISFEIGTFVVGTINEVQLAINTVIITMLTALFMVHNYRN